MEYQSTSKYVRTSPRKLRLIADAVKKLSPSIVVNKLVLLEKRAGEPLRQAIASALSNAKNARGNTDSLRFKTIEIMSGPAMKRWHAVSRGQAHAYKKRMSHIKVVLTDEKIKN